MWSALLMTSTIRCPLWSSEYECQRVECAFTLPMRTECCMFVMCCIIFPWQLFCSAIFPRYFVVLQTKIPGTIIKFIANYIKGRNAYTTYRNYTSLQCQFKTGVPQGGVLSQTLFNIYTADIPPPRAPVQVITYADDITINPHTQSRVQPRNAYNHTYTYIKFLPGKNKTISH